MKLGFWIRFLVRDVSFSLSACHRFTYFSPQRDVAYVRSCLLTSDSGFGGFFISRSIQLSLHLTSYLNHTISASLDHDIWWIRPPRIVKEPTLTLTGTTGSAYTVGPMNRDHWLLYLTSPNAQPLLPSDSSLTSSFHLSLPSPGPLSAIPSGGHFDSTLEILMTHLAPAARAPFFIPEGSASEGGHALGVKISKVLGIDTLFPAEETQLDSFGFDPCGYSANGVVGSGSPHGNSSDGGGGYYTIHVTPEEGWSFASFECNVPLPISSSTSSTSSQSTTTRPTLPNLIKKVVSIFQPSRLSITLFVSTAPSTQDDNEDGNWTAFGKDLLSIDGYDRKDRIGYEFDGYDLVFACFEKTGWVEERFAGVQGRLEESGRLLDKLTLEE